MRDLLTVTRPEDAGHPAQGRSPHPRPARRRIVASLALTVVAALLVPAMAVSAGAERSETRPRAGADAQAPCTRTVNGFTASAVESARNGAGSGGIVCFPAGTYVGSLQASVAGQTWRLADNAKLTGVVNITAPGVTLLNGQMIRPAVDRWMASVQIRAHDVTVQSIVFRGGGTGIGVYGKDRSRIISNDFKHLTGSSISVWSEGVGADHTLIYNNTIVQTATYRVSPITSRGNEGGGHGGVQNYRTIIRDNTIDQGAGDLGWFGIEMKQSKNAIIERNTVKGGKVLVSLPETDKALIRYNTFDLRGSPFWAIEVGNAWDAIIDENTFIGDGSKGVDYAMSLNTNPLRMYARKNKASNIRTLVGIAGDGHRVKYNCLSGVAHVHEFMLNGGPNIVFTSNGRC